MHVIARRPFSYNHRGIHTGEIFEVPAEHAKLLLMAGSVRPAEERSPQPRIETPAPPEPEPPEPPVKRGRGRPRKHPVVE